MNSIARPRSRRSSSRIAITSAWVVTSSAVVGSSASSSRGSVEQRGGDHDALQQAAGQLVRVLPQPPLAVVDADLGEHVDRAARAPRPRGTPRMRAQRLGHEVADPAHRVDVRARVLEDHRHLAAVLRAARRRGSASTSRPSKRIAPVDLGAGRQQPRDRPRGHRLARARLADQPDAPRRRRSCSETSCSTVRRSPSTGSSAVRLSTSSSAAVTPRAPAPIDDGAPLGHVEPRPRALERRADPERRHVVVGARRRSAGRSGRRCRRSRTARSAPAGAHDVEDRRQRRVEVDSRRGGRRPRGRGRRSRRRRRGRASRASGRAARRSVSSSAPTGA